MTVAYEFFLQVETCKKNIHVYVNDCVVEKEKHVRCKSNSQVEDPERRTIVFPTVS